MIQRFRHKHLINKMMRNELVTFHHKNKYTRKAGKLKWILKKSNEEIEKQSKALDYGQPNWRTDFVRGVKWIINEIKRL